MSVPSVAWLRGQIVPFAEATLPIEDRGVQFGESLYEVLPVTRGQARYLFEHAARLRSAASELGLEDGAPSDADWQALCRALLDREGLDEGLLIAQLTGGTQPRSHLPKERRIPSFFAYLREFRFPRESAARAGIRAITHPDQRWARSDLKTTMLLGSVLAKRAAAERGGSEAILVGDDGLVHEGASSNVFVVEGRTLVTPAQTNHVLPGVTRGSVVRLAEASGLSVQHAALAVDRLRAADELFVTATSLLVMPVVALDERPVGSGGAGPIATSLAAALRRELGLDD